MEQEGCICQNCGKRYNLDLNVPDEIWECIKPDEKPAGAGLLCPSCIGERLEKNMDRLGLTVAFVNMH